MDEQFQNLLILGIFQVLKFWKFVNFTIWKIPKTYYLENSENFEFGKLVNYQIAIFD